MSAVICGGMRYRRTGTINRPSITLQQSLVGIIDQEDTPSGSFIGILAKIGSVELFGQVEASLGPVVGSPSVEGTVVTLFNLTGLLEELDI